MTKRRREQPGKVKTGRDKIWMSLLFTAVLLVISALLIIRMFLTKEEGEYIPPEFEAKAVTGVPKPEENYMYGGTTTDYGFSFQMASNLFRQEDGTLKVYFTNPKDNEVYLMLALFDSVTEEKLYQSGVIKPGEYVETLKPKANYPNEFRSVTAKIYAFETTNWYSEGTIEIMCEIQPW